MAHAMVKCWLGWLATRGAHVWGRSGASQVSLGRSGVLWGVLVSSEGYGALVRSEAPWDALGRPGKGRSVALWGSYRGLTGF